MLERPANITDHTCELGPPLFFDSLDVSLARPHPLNILVIDDSDTDFMIARRMLRLMDTFEVTLHHAHDLPEARAIFDREQLDVVFVDFCLGLETGAGAIADLGGRIAAAVPILLTGMPGQDVAHIALRAGAVHCLDKNHLTPVMMETTIRSALHTHALEKKLQAAIADLELANRVKSDFFARIGRDLKGPLQSILDYADSITAESSGQLSGEKYSSYADSIRGDSKYLLDVLNALVEDELNADIATRETIDLRTIIRDAFLAVERERQTQGYRFELSLPDEPANVVCQPFVLTQAFFQLLHTAVERSLPQEKISVSVKKQEDYWVLRINDTGMKQLSPDPAGASNPDELSQDHRHRLGLSIVFDIVKNHHGILDIESIPNAGTIVSLSLPVAV